MILHACMNIYESKCVLYLQVTSTSFEQGSSDLEQKRMLDYFLTHVIFSEL